MLLNMYSLIIIQFDNLSDWFDFFFNSDLLIYYLKKFTILKNIVHLDLLLALMDYSRKAISKMYSFGKWEITTSP